MFFPSTQADADPPVPDGSRYVLAAVIVPIVCVCLFGGFQFLPGGPESWTNYLKLDPADDTCALINYGIVAGAAIVGMGAGMKLGGEHFPGRLIAGSVVSFCLAMLANGVYTRFKGATVQAVQKAVGVSSERGESDGESDEHESDELEPDDDEEEEAPDALREVAMGQWDADGPRVRRGPALEVPVEHGTYESMIEPGSFAITKGLANTCITGCLL